MNEGIQDEITSNDIPTNIVNDLKITKLKNPSGWMIHHKHKGALYVSLEILSNPVALESILNEDKDSMVIKALDEPGKTRSEVLISLISHVDNA